MAGSKDVAPVAEVDRRLALAEQYREANAAAAVEAYEAGHMQLAVSVAPAWIAEPGEILEGTVFGILPRVHPEYGAYPIVGLKRRDGSLVAIHGLPQTLHDGLKAVRPQAGDPLVVAHLGDRLSSKREDTEYHLYAVSIPGKAIAPYEW